MALRLCVGDLSLQQLGAVRFLADQFPSADFDFIRSLESPVGCSVSVSSASGDNGKSILLTSSCSLGHRIQGRFASMGIPLVSGARNFGMDYMAGRSKGGAVRATRFSKAALRRRTLAGLHRFSPCGATKVARSGLVASCSYGTVSTGLWDAQYSAIRQEVGRTMPGKNAGRSLTVRLALARVDPGPSLDAAVIVGCCYLWWESALPHRLLTLAWGMVTGRADASVL